MTKLSDDQIEDQITQSHATIIAIATVCAGNDRILDPAIRRELRACFTAGKDHGESCIIERAAGLVAVDAEREKEAGIGRAVMVLTMWVLLNPQRGWNVNLNTSQPSVWLHAAPDESLGSDICGPKGYHCESGADLFEAFDKIAAWCTEHARIIVSRDTEPAPAMADDGLPASLPRIEAAPAVGGSHCVDVYERMLKSSAVVQTFDGSDDAPSTPRNL